MLYGHIENFHHRVDHLSRLRALQDETRGFNVFIPLSFQPFQNELGIECCHPRHDRRTTASYLAFAKETGLWADSLKYVEYERVLKFDKVVP